MKHGQQRLRAGAAQSLSDRVTTWLFLLPALAVIMVVCIVIGLNVEGSSKGLAYMFKPDLSSFSFEAISKSFHMSLYLINDLA